MYSIVRQLRKNGIRRPDRDFNNDPGVAGMIVLICHGSHSRLSLERWGDNSPGNTLLPNLYDAYCVTWMDATSLWRGYQRDHEKAPTFLQEWHVTILKERPEPGDVGDFMVTHTGGGASRVGKI